MFFMDWRIKPNTRGCFAFREFSVVCGIELAERPFRDDSARKVSPPRDFSQHDSFKEKRPFLPFPMQSTYLGCGHFVIGNLRQKENFTPQKCANAHSTKKAWPEGHALGRSAWVDGLCQANLPLLLAPQIALDVEKPFGGKIIRQRLCYDRSENFG